IRNLGKKTRKVITIRRCGFQPGEYCAKSNTKRWVRSISRAQDYLPRGVRKRIFDHVPYRLPGAAFELNQSHLLDGAEILRTRVDFDAGQEDGGLVVLEDFCLPHHVFAGEIVAALLEHLRKRLCSRVAVKSGTA